MKTVKPDLDLCMYSITLNLKPWKGKISAIVFIALSSESELMQHIRERIEVLKKEGKYKRRTITDVSISIGGKL